MARRESSLSAGRTSRLLVIIQRGVRSCQRPFLRSSLTDSSTIRFPLRSTVSPFAQISDLSLVLRPILLP